MASFNFNNTRQLMKLFPIKLTHTILGGTAAFALLSVAHALTYEEAMKSAGEDDRRGRHFEAEQGYGVAESLAGSEQERGEARLGRKAAIAGSGRVVEVSDFLEGIATDPQADDSQRITAWRALGDGWMERRDFAAAAQAYGNVLEFEETGPAPTVQALNRLAAAELAAGRYAEARQAFEQSLAEPHVGDFHLEDAWLGVGKTYRLEGNHGAAKAAFLACLESDRANAATKRRAKRMLADTAYDSGDYPAALGYYLELVEEGAVTMRIAERMDTIYRDQLAKAERLLAADRAEEAEQAFREALEMPGVEEHHSGRAWLGIGASLAARNANADALAAYQQVAELSGAHDADRGRALLAIAALEIENQNREAARAACTQLIDLENTSRFDRERAAQMLESL